MKRPAAILLSLLCVLPVVLVVSFLNKNPEHKGIPAAIMVDGVVYYSTGQAMPIEVDESAILGEIDSHTDGIPTKNGQGNFNPELGNLYTRIEDDIGVLIEHEWVRFEAENAPKAGNHLWDNASPSTSLLTFSCFDGKAGWSGWPTDLAKQNEILAGLAAVNAERISDWTPKKARFPVYGIEIGTK